MKYSFIKYILISLLGIFLVSCSLKREDLGIKRERAYELLALSLEKKEAILENTKLAKEKAYKEFLLNNNIINNKLYEKKAEDFVTYEDLEIIYASMNKNEDIDKLFKSKRSSSDISKDTFYEFYEFFIKEKDKNLNISILEDTLYNIEEGDKLQKVSFINTGIYTCDTFIDFSKYLDCKLKFVVADKELLYVKEIVSTEIEYHNVLFKNADNNKLSILLMQADRVLDMDKSIKKLDIEEESIIDLKLNNKKVVYITVRNKKIYAKVLAVDSKAIELEGYGRLEVSKEFSSYVAGEEKRESLKQIMIGSTVHNFYVEDNKIQAAIRMDKYSYEKIRVLIMNDFYRIKQHYTIKLKSRDGLRVVKGEESFEIAQNEEFSLTKDSLKENERIFIYSLSDAEIEVSSLKRDVGNPSYAGHLEVVRKDSEIYLINELSMEEYLRKVVPSEMPPNYNIEAIKAQTLVARTYAAKAMSIPNSLRIYGANVDDSINFQVYGNKLMNSEADRAISETAGKLIFYKGEPASTFYYDTSAGVSTDMSIWGSDASAYPYIGSYGITPDKKVLNLSTNLEFKKFLDDAAFPAYEKNYSFYRWETVTSNKILNEDFWKVGNILNLAVTKRGKGGVVTSLRIDGEEGSYTLEGYNEIRALLGNEKLKITKYDGKIVSGMKSLPSSFIYIESSRPDENNVIKFTIKGAGFGHGVGLSQNAANEMAKSGMKAEDIIGFFFEGTVLE